MEEESIIKKIFNFFLHVFLAITSFLKKLFGKEEKDMKAKVVVENKIVQDKKKKIDNIDNTSLPDTTNINANDHNGNDNKDNNVILKLTNEDLKKIRNTEENFIIITEEELDELINECLEEEYEEEKLKIKEANRELKEKIKEFKEKIVDVIKENIVKKEIKAKETLKDEIKEVIKEEIIEKPLIPKLKDLRKQKEVKAKDVYFLAAPLKKDLKIKNEKVTVTKPSKVLTTFDNKKIKDKLEERPYFMVQNKEEIPKENIKDDLKNMAIVGGMLGANAILDLVTPLPKDEKEKKNDEKQEEKETEKVVNVNPKEKDLKLEEEPQVIKTENVLEEDVVLPKLQELEEQLEAIKEDKSPTLTEDQEAIGKEEKPKVKQKEEQTETRDTSIEEIKSPVEEIKQEVKQDEDLEVSPLKEEPINSNKVSEKIDNSILEITLASAAIISDTEKETEKKELEDKDYDSKEAQINKMLDDIEVTLLKYDGKMNEKQKLKLKQEQEKLRDSKEHLASKKQEDITKEAKALDETIKEVELSGLQNELKRLHIENQIEMNETLLNRINGLKNLTREQVANIDKKMLMKRLNKVSMLMEMSSILALPFVRNKYFFYFTVGLIIDNHFNFINAFFMRKINRYKPADLEQIKQGEDALNSALNMTYKNQIQLEYVVSEALAKYPELADDPLFTNKVNNLRLQLEHNYQKMMKKKNIMEKYHRKTKSQIKILKRTGELPEAA